MFRHMLRIARTVLILAGSVQLWIWAAEVFRMPASIGVFAIPMFVAAYALFCWGFVMLVKDVRRIWSE